MIEIPNHGIDPQGRQGGHIEGGADLGAAAPDAPFAAPGAAIPVKGRHQAMILQGVWGPPPGTLGKSWSWSSQRG